ncbi:hypothetical protein J1N35_045435 [Gossypium stocksii]|uniref:Pentatricopeptide repeat-containing protein n=1 Tax=Gossypium stocksii TaxID=47602 RepID=A0A9D3ZH01_9ROSI|nr:hypothetical protein J1N35_045435 [Gossypium stocksii]
MSRKAAPFPPAITSVSPLAFITCFHMSHAVPIVHRSVPRFIFSHVDISNKILSKWRGGLNNRGEVGQAVKTLKELEENGPYPNVVTYNTVINAFCKQGLLKEGLVVFSGMLKKGIEPNVYTYQILLDAFYGQRMFCKAEAMISTMKQQRIKFNVVTRHICSKIGKKRS